MSGLIKIIARIRSTMPDDSEVTALCDDLERLVKRPTRKPLTRAEIQRNYRMRQKEKQ